MSKKLTRTIDDWGGGSTRRRRRVRPHVLKAARRAFMLILVGIPAGFFLFQCLCHFAGGSRFEPALGDRNPIPAGRSAGDDAR